MSNLGKTLLPIYLSHSRERNWGRIFRDALIVFSAIFFIQTDLDIFSFTLLFGILFTAFTSLYEIGYLWNDAVRVKHEDKPTIRSYIMGMNVKLAIILRIVYIGLIFLLFGNFSLLLSLTLLSIAIVVHNLENVRLNKMQTYPVLRLCKLMFMPIALSNMAGDTVFCSLVLLLPFLFIDSIFWILDATNKYHVDAEIKPPTAYYKWLLYFIPFQFILLTFYTPLVFLGETLFILMSIIRNQVK